MTDKMRIFKERKNTPTHSKTSESPHRTTKILSGFSVWQDSLHCFLQNIAYKATNIRDKVKPQIEKFLFNLS